MSKKMEWWMRTAVSVFTGFSLLGASQAFAMGVPPTNGGMVLLAPDTVTVTGSASEVISNPVDDVSISVNLSDTSYASLAHDASGMVKRIDRSMRSLGIAPGNVLLGTPNFNNGSNGPSENFQINVVVAKATQVTSVLSALTDASQYPQVQNEYTNVQVVSLNPAVLWKPLYDAAIANAREQAAYLAKEAGKQLGSIVSISMVPQQGYTQSVSGPYPTSPTFSGLQMTQQYGGTTVPEVSTQLFVTYSLIAG